MFQAYRWQFKGFRFETFSGTNISSIVISVSRSVYFVSLVNGDSGSSETVFHKFLLAHFLVQASHRFRLIVHCLRLNSLLSCHWLLPACQDWPEPLLDQDKCGSTPPHLINGALACNLRFCRHFNQFMVCAPRKLWMYGGAADGGWPTCICQQTRRNTVN